MIPLPKQRPPSGTPRPFTMPTLQRATAPGITVIGVHLPNRPKAYASLSADAGASAEPLTQAGLSSLLAEVLERGAAGRDANELALAFEHLGGFLGTSGGYDRATVSTDVPAAFLPKAVALLTDVARRPNLTDEDVAAQHGAQLDHLRSMSANPAAIAEHAALHALWHDDSRFALPTSGDTASVTPLTAEDVRAFHANRWRDAHLTVTVAGDLSGVDLAALADAAAADAAAPTRSNIATGRNPGAAVVIHHRADAAQGQVVLAQASPPRKTPDLPALQIGMSLWGGAFASRLMTRLREELGYTYGVRAGADLLRDGGTLAVRWSGRTDATVDAIREAVEVTQQLLDDGPNDDEVKLSRDLLAAKLPFRAETPRGLGGLVATLVVHDLPDDHHERHAQALREVTTEDVQAALRRHLDPSSWVTAIAGDADVLAGPLEDAGRGPVTVVRD